MLVIIGGVPGAALCVVFMAMGAFYTYFFGFRQVQLVALTPAELRWLTFRRREAVPLGDVRSIRCAKAARRGATVDIVTVEFANRAPLKFAGTTPGLKEFLAKIRKTAPHVTVEAPLG